MTSTFKTEKWATHIAMIRLVRSLNDRLEEMRHVEGCEIDEMNNVLNAFLLVLPKGVETEIRNG